MLQCVLIRHLPKDAFALASLLSLPEINAQTLSLALQVYDEVRRPFSQEVIRRSYETGQLYFMESGKMGNVSSEHSAAAHFPPEALNAQAQDLKAAFHWSSGNVPYDPDEVVNTFEDRLRHFSKQE